MGQSNQTPRTINELTTIDQVDERIDLVIGHLTPDRSLTARIAGGAALLALGRRRNEIVAEGRRDGLPTLVVVDAAGVAVLHMGKTAQLDLS